MQQMSLYVYSHGGCVTFATRLFRYQPCKTSFPVSITGTPECEVLARIVMRDAGTPGAKIYDGTFLT
jgi:hypothetical protein